MDDEHDLKPIGRLAKRIPPAAGGLLSLLALASPALAAVEVPDGIVLIEAEQFGRLGGWVNDQQFMDQMGSPFLLAHGLGVPVADATTTVKLPSPGTYRVWVRTRDWVATWKAPGAPGRFKLAVDGEPLAVTFGTEGAKWHWQDGGTVELAGATATLALHDLTGFEGRCDAIVLSKDLDFVPPNTDPAMAAFRRKLLGLPETPVDGGQFDLVVVGGGIAGTCAALSAGRLGLTVALIQDRPVVGGNNSSEVRVWLGGARNKPPYPRVGDIVAELEQARRAHHGPDNTGEIYEDDRKLGLLRAEKTITVMLGYRANAVAKDGQRLVAVIAQDTTTGRRVRVAGRWFVDATGDGCIGYLAGADHEMTPTGHMGRCNLWNVADTGKPTAFPRCPWALDLSDKPFPGRSSGGIKNLGVWYWESGFDHDPFEKSEYIRDWNFRAMYGAWDALKNVDGKYPNHKLNWAAYISGKRESRRLLGDIVLTKEDLLTSKEYPDGCVPTGWTIDLHLPDPKYVKGFEGEGFIAKASFGKYKMPYWVPYRCLYSRNVGNLFMAGRDISVTHGALGAVRVMRTCGCMGEIVGMAASICKSRNTTPRGVYTDHLDELKALMRRGVGKAPPARAASSRPPAEPLTPPAWLATAGKNLARQATVTVSSIHPKGAYKADSINDGDASTADNDRRWLSDANPPHQAELAWEKPITINAVRIVSGWNAGGRIEAALEGFLLEYHDGREWKPVPGGDVSGNARADWGGRFAPIEARRLRLTITAAHGGFARIWEWEVYNVPPPGVGEPRPDISSARPDLETPAMTEGPPAPGKRVRQVAPEYAGTQVYHTLYLPTDWVAGRKYPVLVEYAGNGPYRNKFGDVSDGTVEGGNLGYGLSGGKGFIWLSLPFVSADGKGNQRQWWGDVEATVAYCKKAVPRACEAYGGDPSAVILIGFSRGAIACNYIGLHDDQIAALWRAFVPYSHYDGVRRWGYPGSDRDSAIARLRRLAGRPQFICMENSVEETRAYLAGAGVRGEFTFMTTPFRNHNDRWAHRDTPQRRRVRQWLNDVLATAPSAAAVEAGRQ